MGYVSKRPLRPAKAPTYCQGFIDRTGKTRWYFRRPGWPRAVLPGLPWSPSFMAAYEAAMRGEKPEIRPSRAEAGTIAALTESYFRSSGYRKLKPITQQTYANLLKRICDQHGDKRVKMLRRGHVSKVIGDMADTPSAANRLLRMLRLLMRHAVDLEWIERDPTDGVETLAENPEGFTTWSEEQIAAFLDFHKPGSRAHIAMQLLLLTGQRRGDIVLLGPGNIKDGYLSLIQSKTGQLVEIPVRGALAAFLGSLPKDAPTFVLGAMGKPMTPAAFTNWFRKMVKEVTHEVDGVAVRSLPDGISPHGLRKAVCRRLAEMGCSAHEIMAISGHRTLNEVTRYTAAVDRRHLANRVSDRSIDRDSAAG